MLGEKKQRVRRSVEERAAALDAKIQTHKEAIKALEEKKAALFRPKKKRRSDAEIGKAGARNGISFVISLHTPGTVALSHFLAID